jgi:hypothetical protein
MAVLAALVSIEDVPRTYTVSTEVVLREVIVTWSMEVVRGYPRIVPDHYEPLYNGIDLKINEQSPYTAWTLLKNLDDYLKEVR